jgi:hypothetical protein
MFFLDKIFGKCSAGWFWLRVCHVAPVKTWKSDRLEKLEGDQAIFLFFWSL